MKKWWAKRKAKLADEARQARQKKWEAERQEFLDKKAKGLLTSKERFEGNLKFSWLNAPIPKIPPRPPKKSTDENG